MIAMGYAGAATEAAPSFADAMPCSSQLDRMSALRRRERPTLPESLAPRLGRRQAVLSAFDQDLTLPPGHGGKNSQEYPARRSAGACAEVEQPEPHATPIQVTSQAEDVGRIPAQPIKARSS